MIPFVVIAVIVVVVAGVAGYLIQLSRKQKVVVPVVAKKSFHVIVNYVTSYIKTYGGTDYVFLNISIDNKSDEDMTDVVIETVPNIPIVTDLRYKAISEKWEADSHDPVFSDSLTSRVMSIEAGTMVSGYLIVATRNAQINIEGLTIESNGELQEIVLRKERINFKSNNLRKF